MHQIVEFTPHSPVDNSGSLNLETDQSRYSEEKIERKDTQGGREVPHAPVDNLDDLIDYVQSEPEESYQKEKVAMRT